MPEKPDDPKSAEKPDAPVKQPRKADIPMLVFDTLRKLGSATELELLEAIEPFPDGLDADRLRSILADAPPSEGIEGWTVAVGTGGASRTEWSTGKHRKEVLGG